MAFMLAKAIKTTKPRPRRGEATRANWQLATGNRLHATGGSSSSSSKKASPAVSTANKVGFYSIVRLISHKAAPMGNGQRGLNGLNGLMLMGCTLHPQGFDWALGSVWGLRIVSCDEDQRVKFAELKLSIWPDKWPNISKAIANKGEWGRGNRESKVKRRVLESQRKEERESD